MYDKIVVGHDGSEPAEDALTFARRIAKALNARLTLVEVMPYEPLLSEITIGPPTTLAAQRDSTRERLKTLARSLDLEAEAVEATSPARGLHEAAERLDADLVVIGSGHRGAIGRVLAGSVGRALLNGAPCAVAIAPHGYRDRAERTPILIGVGFDGSPEAEVALHTAAELAGRLDASLRVVSVVPPINYGYTGAWVVAYPDLAPIRHEECERRLNKALERLGPTVHAEGRVIDGTPAQVLVEQSDEGLDMLFVGSRGYGRLRGVLLGSVTGEVIGSAQCPLVVIPRGTERQGEATTAKAASTAH